MGLRTRVPVWVQREQWAAMGDPWSSFQQSSGWVTGSAAAVASDQAAVYQYQRLNASGECRQRMLRRVAPTVHRETCTPPAHVVFAQADWFAAFKASLGPTNDFPSGS